MAWQMFNRLTEEIESVDVIALQAERLKDFLPQHDVRLGLFDVHVAKGMSPLDALEDVLRACARAYEERT